MAYLGSRSGDAIKHRNLKTLGENEMFKTKLELYLYLKARCIAFGWTVEEARERAYMLAGVGWRGKVAK